MTGDARVEEELQLTDYLTILRRRWVWVLLSTAAVLSGAVAITAFSTPSYTATAQVALGNSAAQEAIRTGNSNNAYAAIRELSNEVNLAVSDAVTDNVEEQLGLIPDVAIEPAENSDALTFTSVAATADNAALHANTWAEVYVETKRKQATDSIEAAIEDFKTDLTSLRAERQTLQQPLDRIDDQIAAAADEASQAALQRSRDRMAADLSLEFEILDSQASSLAVDITNLQLSSRLAGTGTASIVQVAAPPQSATNSSPARTLVLATIVGLILGAVVALIVDNLDRTIKTTDDVASLGVPVLGGIPLPGRSIPESELALATMRYTGTPMAEAYQKTRTAVEFALLGREINSLLITSPNQSEGKTTLAVNLAWAMSAVDHRVALVDVDFRQPRVHKVFDCSAFPGLSDNLLTGIPLPQLALRVDEHGSRNLIVLPAGTQPPSPADFVASPAFSSLIKKIEAEADLVVLDAPPVLPVSDAASIGRQVDAVIVVVKAGSTTRDQLINTLDDLKGVGADVIGVCVMGLRSSSTAYGYAPDERRSRRRKQVLEVRDEATVEPAAMISDDPTKPFTTERGTPEGRNTGHQQPNW